MEKSSKMSLLTGAKKVGKSISVIALATTLAFANPISASAHVEAENVIGDALITVDRSQVKVDEATAINTYFTQYDYYGDTAVTTDTIRLAVELSNALNAANGYNEYFYSNTTKNEILGLDIYGMFADYGANQQDFCARNLTNKPAIDAYLNFSCGRLTANIREEIELQVFNALQTEGRVVNVYPRVQFVDGQLVAVVTVDNQVNVIRLNCVGLEELISNYYALQDRYNICINNVAGYSPDFVNSLSYNGVAAGTNESAYLSLGDDGLKEMLLKGCEFVEQLQNGQLFNVDLGASNARYYLTDAERTMLTNMGYTEEQINNAVSRIVTLTKTEEYSK